MHDRPAKQDAGERLMLDMNKTATKFKMFSLLLLVGMTLIAGCDPITFAATSFGAGLWIDIFLTPLRSLIGGAALDVVNTF